MRRSQSNGLNYQVCLQIVIALVISKAKKVLHPEDMHSG